VCLSPLIHSYIVQCLSVDQLYKGQLAKLPAILDSFYITITNDHIGVEVGGGGEPQSGGFSMCRSRHCQMVSSEVHVSSRYHK